MAFAILPIKLPGPEQFSPPERYAGPDDPIARAFDRKLRNPDVPFSDPNALLNELAATPDAHFYDRARLALLLSNAAPERSLAAARRLLKEERLQPILRAHAALALYLSGADKAELETALKPVPDDITIGMVRLVVGLKQSFSPAEVYHVFAVATSEDADRLERGLALASLAALPKGVLTEAKGQVSQRPLSPSVQPAGIGPWGSPVPRGWSATPGLPAGHLEPVLTVPAGRPFSLQVSVAPSPLPQRLHCPDNVQVQETVVDLPASDTTQTATCWLRADIVGPLELNVSVNDPLNLDYISYTPLSITVTSPQTPTLSDPLSLDEQIALAEDLARAGKREALPTLDRFIGMTELNPQILADLVQARLDLALKLDDPALQVRAFESLRERQPHADLSLTTAAAIAHAYARTGEPARALAATRVVLDAGFQRDLDPVQALHVQGLALTALKLLKSLISEQPEVPSVISARFLVPGMLLERADGDGDRLGYTRSSLRHTAAAELAGFLLDAPDSPSAPNAAVMLLDTLEKIQEPGRAEALAGPLARRYRKSAQGVALGMAYARVLYADDKMTEALAVLNDLPASPSVSLYKGRILERMDRRDAAIEAYQQSGTAEALSRLTWMQRTGLPQDLVVNIQNGRLAADLVPGTSTRASAWPVKLERLVLRDGGTLDPTAAVLDGLPGAVHRDATVGGDGDVPMPSLGTGAWLLSVEAGDQSLRAVALVQGLDLKLRAGSGGTLVEVRTESGQPVDQAHLWYFPGDGTTATTTTDPAGTTWIPGGLTAVLASTTVGGKQVYGYATIDTIAEPPSPAPAQRYYDFDENAAMKNESAAGYEELLKARTSVQADSL